MVNGAIEALTRAGLQKSFGSQKGVGLFCIGGRCEYPHVGAPALLNGYLGSSSVQTTIGPSSTRTCSKSWAGELPFAGTFFFSRWAFCVKFASSSSPSYPPFFAVLSVTSEQLRCHEVRLRPGATSNRRPAP